MEPSPEPSQVFVKPLEARQANVARNSLMQFFYWLVFDWCATPHPPPLTPSPLTPHTLNIGVRMTAVGEA